MKREKTINTNIVNLGDNSKLNHILSPKPMRALSGIILLWVFNNGAERGRIMVDDLGVSHHNIVLNVTKMANCNSPANVTFVLIKCTYA
jgi:hypothetical protein